MNLILYFRTLDSDNNGFLDFKEFLLAMDLVAARLVILDNIQENICHRLGRLRKNCCGVSSYLTQTVLVSLTGRRWGTSWSLSTTCWTPSTPSPRMTPGSGPTPSSPRSMSTMMESLTEKSF